MPQALNKYESCTPLTKDGENQRAFKRQLQPFTSISEKNNSSKAAWQSFGKDHNDLMLLGPQRIAVNAQLLQPGTTPAIQVGDTWQTTHAVLCKEHSEVHIPTFLMAIFCICRFFYLFFCKHSYSNNITGGGDTTNRQHDHDNVVHSFLPCFHTAKCTVDIDF